MSQRLMKFGKGSFQKVEMLKYHVIKAKYGHELIDAPWIPI